MQELENKQNENFIIKINGKRFYCNCRCNVFHKPHKEIQNIYKCNACGCEYESEQ